MKEILTAKVVSSSESEDLVKLAKKKGIVIPSDHLGAFKTVYAQADGRANRNGIRLNRKAVKAALPSLIGSQVNINHWRQNWTVGSIFWAKLNENDEIEVAFTFFKDVYAKEYAIAKELFENGELTVSFELIADAETQEYNNDGTRTLNDVIFVGCGLLLDEKPAEPTAIVFEMAKRQILDLIGQDQPDLIYAKKAVVNCQDLLETINKALEEKEKQVNTNTTLPETQEVNGNREENNNKILDQDLEEGGSDSMDKLKKDLEVQAEEQKEEIVAEVEESKDEETAQTVEEATEEPVEEASEEVAEEPEEAKTEVVTEKTEVVVETMDENSDTVKVDSEVKQTVVRDDEVVSEVVNKKSEETVFTFAEVEAIKADYEAKIASLEGELAKKDEEIEVAKDMAVKIEKIKAELGDYVADFTEADFNDEIKLENARLKKENAELKDSKKEAVEEASEEVVEEPVVETASLETGHEETSSSNSSALVEVMKSKKK